MCRFLLCTAAALYFSVLAATAADRYGDWLLEQPRSSVLTLSFKQSVPLDNKIVTSELGFICDQKDKSIGVILIPFDGAFKNRQNVIPVLIQKNEDNMTALICYNVGKTEPTISFWMRKMTSMSLLRT